MVPPDQLDDDRLFGFQVVIQASGWMPLASAISCRVCGARGGEHAGGGVEDLIPALRIQGVHGVRIHPHGTTFRRAHISSRLGLPVEGAAENGGRIPPAS